MVVDRKSWLWILAAAATLTAATLGYVTYADHSVILSGGSWPGFAFGVVGSAIILFCMLLSVRKALRTAPLGPARHWMQAHVWFGLISYPLIWFHAAFRLGGTLTMVLMIIFTVVWLSGIIGLLLQHRTPTRILRNVPHATIHEQITHIGDQLRSRAEAIVAAAGAPVASPSEELAVVGTVAVGSDSTRPPREGVAAAHLAKFLQFYRQSVSSLLTGSSRSRLHGTALSATFADIRGQLPNDFLAPLIELEAIVRERQELDEQRRLHRLLNVWLLIHVPLSYSMLVLSVIHAVMALKFRGIG